MVERVTGSADHSGLGFWRFLVSRRYLTSLWLARLSQAFPHAPGTAREQRQQVESDLQQLLYLRNRAAHHEPIHRRDLAADLLRSVPLVGYVDPVARDWVLAHEALSEILPVDPWHSADGGIADHEPVDGAWQANFTILRVQVAAAPTMQTSEPSCAPVLPSDSCNSKARPRLPAVRAAFVRRVGVTGFEPAASSSRTGDHSALPCH